MQKKRYYVRNETWWGVIYCKSYVIRNRKISISGAVWCDEELHFTPFEFHEVKLQLVVRITGAGQNAFADKILCYIQARGKKPVIRKCRQASRGREISKQDMKCQAVIISQRVKFSLAWHNRQRAETMLRNSPLNCASLIKSGPNWKRVLIGCTWIHSLVREEDLVRKGISGEGNPGSCSGCRCDGPEIGHITEKLQIMKLSIL